MPWHNSSCLLSFCSVLQNYILQKMVGGERAFGCCGSQRGSFWWSELICSCSLKSDSIFLWGHDLGSVFWGLNFLVIIKTCICHPLLQTLLTMEAGFGGPWSCRLTTSVIGRLLTVLLGRRKERAGGNRCQFDCASSRVSPVPGWASRVSLDGHGPSLPSLPHDLMLAPSQAVSVFSSQLRMSKWLVLKEPIC